MSSPRSEPAPPHAPELGWTRRWLGAFHVTGIFWYRIHRFGTKLLPSWAFVPIVCLFTSFFFVALVRIRRAVGSNLEAVLGPASWARRQVRAYRTLWNFAWCLTERYERLSTDRRGQAEAEGLEHWSEPGGLILTTAHIGHWEVGAMLAPDHEDRPVHVVREEEMDERAQEFVRELFEAQHHARLEFHFAHDDPTLGPKLLGALRRGEIVALQSDRPRTGGRTVPVRLFDRPFALPTGPMVMARAADVPIVPVFVFREGRRRSRVVFRPPIRVARSKDRRRDLQEAADRLAEGIEWAIRERPHQWFCFRALWPEVEGEGEVDPG